jgi:hypothetical protein
MFRFVCVPSSLEGAPAGWAHEMLREGEIALLGDEGLDAVNQLAHELDQTSILLVRTETSTERQDETVIAFAGSLPLVWVAGGFNDGVAGWARDRGPDDAARPDRRAIVR